MPRIDSSPILLPSTPSHQEEKAQTNGAPLEGWQRETFIHDPRDIIPFLDSHINRERFTVGREGAEIQFGTSWPMCCEVGVNAIKGRIAGRIGVAPVVSACIWAGIGNVRDRSFADELLTLKETFNQKSAVVSGRVADAIQSQFKGVVFNLPRTAGGKKTDSFKIRAPELVRNHVAGLSGDLGVPVSHLSILAVMATLIRQPDGIINPDHRKEMEELLGDFFDAVETQVRIVRVIMKEFGLSPPPTQDLEPQYRTYPTG